MAFVHFYLTGGGTGASDLNAGSTAGAVAYTSVNGNWNSATNTFTPTDGSTPANSVAAGDYVSVYLDAATVTTFVAKVASVAAGVNGAIVVDATIFYGTAPSTGATGRSLKAGGQWSTEQVLAAGGLGTTTVPQSTKVNIKAATYTITASRTVSMAGATTTPLWFSGYNTTPGDLDADTTNSLTKPLLAFDAGFRFTTSGNHQTWSSFTATANVSNAVWTTNGTHTYLLRCRVTNTSTNAAAYAGNFGGSNNAALYCYFKAPTSGTTNGVVVLNNATAIITGCVCEGGGKAGLDIAGAATTVSDCVLLNNTGAGILDAGGNPRILHCTISNATVDGIKLTATPGAGTCIVGCLFRVCGGIGINNASGTNTNLVHRSTNDFYSCTGGSESGFGDSVAFFGQTDSTDPVISASDLTLVGGVNARQNGFPGIVENETFSSFQDIGAVQGIRPSAARAVIIQNIGTY